MCDDDERQCIPINVQIYKYLFIQSVVVTVGDILLMPKRYINHFYILCLHVCAAGITYHLVT